MRVQALNEIREKWLHHIFEIFSSKDSNVKHFIPETMGHLKF